VPDAGGRFRAGRRPSGCAGQIDYAENNARHALVRGSSYRGMGHGRRLGCEWVRTQDGTIGLIFKHVRKRCLSIDGRADAARRVRRDLSMRLKNRAKILS